MTPTRFGVAGSEAYGIFFSEVSSIAGARDLGKIEVKIGGQNKDLRDVKAALAEETRRRDGNGLVAFEYGQRRNPRWKSVTGLFDAEYWYGSGHAVVLPPPDH